MTYSRSFDKTKEESEMFVHKIGRHWVNKFLNILKFLITLSLHGVFGQQGV